MILFNKSIFTLLGICLFLICFYHLRPITFNRSPAGNLDLKDSSCKLLTNQLISIDPFFKILRELELNEEDFSSKEFFKAKEIPEPLSNTLKYPGVNELRPYAVGSFGNIYLTKAIKGDGSLFVLKEYRKTPLFDNKLVRDEDFLSLSKARKFIKKYNLTKELKLPWFQKGEANHFLELEFINGLTLIKLLNDESIPLPIRKSVFQRYNSVTSTILENLRRDFIVLEESRHIRKLSTYDFSQDEIIEIDLKLKDPETGEIFRFSNKSDNYIVNNKNLDLYFIDPT